METKFNKETGKTSWVINKWWQKTFYVIGAIYCVYLTACFVVGLIIGIVVL